MIPCSLSSAHRLPLGYSISLPLNAAADDVLTKVERQLTTLDEQLERQRNDAPPLLFLTWNPDGEDVSDQWTQALTKSGLLAEGKFSFMDQDPAPLLIVTVPLCLSVAVETLAILDRT